MQSRLSRWSSRALFFAAALALLATSKPKGWSLPATIAGPVTPSAHRGLEVVIDASDEARLEVSGVPKSPYGDGNTPCLSPWTRGAKQTCFLPPGATLTSVEISGGCGGFCAGSCPPPSTAFVRVTTTEKAVWTDSVTSSMPVTLPAHGKDFVATRFNVLVSGAGFIRVNFTATPAAGGPPVLREEQACRLTFGSTTGQAYCMFMIFDSDIPPGGGGVAVTAEATGWGTCADAACAVPKTLRIDTLEVVK